MVSGVAVVPLGCLCCLECSPISPSNSSLRAQPLGHFWETALKIPLLCVHRVLFGPHLPTGLFHASCLLTHLSPRGTRSSLGTKLSLIHLWESRCSQGPHRADSWRTCLEWDINAGSQTSERAFGSDEARSPVCSWEDFAGGLLTGATV